MNKPSDSFRVLFVHRGREWSDAARRTLQGAEFLAARGHVVRVGAVAGSILESRARAAGIEVQREPQTGRTQPFAALRAHWERSRFAPDVQFEDGAGARTARGAHFVPAVNLPIDPIPDREVVRRELRLPRRVFLALHVDDLVPAAGQEVLLHALATLRALGDGTHAAPVVAFLGTGNVEARLHSLVHELGIKEHVLWLGHRTPVERYLEAADVLLVPLAHEALPGTVLDAMARGVPTIAAIASGVQRIVRSDEN